MHSKRLPLILNDSFFHLFNYFKYIWNSILITSFSLWRINQRPYFQFKFFSANRLNQIIINVEKLQLTLHMNRLDHIDKLDIPIVEIFKWKILNALQIHDANCVTRCSTCHLFSSRTHQKWSTIVCLPRSIFNFLLAGNHIHDVIAADR